MKHTAHTQPLQPSWLRGMEHVLRLVHDGGIHAQLGAGVIFRIDKQKKQLITVCESKKYRNTDNDILNRRMFAALGYQVVRHDNVPSDAQTAISILEELSGPTLDVDLRVVNPQATVASKNWLPPHRLRQLEEMFD